MFLFKIIEKWDIEPNRTQCIKNNTHLPVCSFDSFVYFIFLGGNEIKSSSDIFSIIVNARFE